MKNQQANANGGKKDKQMPVNEHQNARCWLFFPYTHWNKKICEKPVFCFLKLNFQNSKRNENAYLWCGDFNITATKYKFVLESVLNQYSWVIFDFKNLVLKTREKNSNWITIFS